MSVTAILFAAGASSRMRGSDKLMEEVRDMPLLRDRAVACLASGASHVRVILPPESEIRRGALAGLNVEIVETKGAVYGMAHSIRLGMTDLRAKAALLMLADLPDITAAHMARIISGLKGHPSKTVFRGATLSGKPGHPVLVRDQLYPALRGLTGDKGAQPVLRQHIRDTVLIPIGDAALADLDTPEDWDAWRAYQ